MSPVRRHWFSRKFELGLPAEALPDVVERLRGTPARLEELVRDIPTGVSRGRREGRWSVHENVGHLWDLEDLWFGRVEDLLEGRDRLRDADLQNRRTEEAGHDDRSIEELLAAFRDARARLVEAVEGMSEEEIARTGLHPRLEQPMTVTDLAFFVAEHDDHHLARITEIIRSPDA